MALFGVSPVRGEKGVGRTYRLTNTNTFPSESDCGKFIMVLQQQWPSFMDRLPGATLRIFRSGTDRNVMQACWALQSKEQADEMQAIGDEIILPYRNKLMPRSLRFEGILTGALPIHSRSPLRCQ